MTKYKALVGFAGALSMYEGEERELPDNKLIKSLVKNKYIKKLKEVEYEEAKGELEEVKGEADEG